MPYFLLCQELDGVYQASVVLLKMALRQSANFCETLSYVRWCG